MRLRFAAPLLAALMVPLTFARPAGAVFIRPTSALASSEFTAGFDARAVNTINGSGMPGGFGPASLHAAYADGNHWTTTGGAPAAEFITWGFAAPQTLDALYLWNHLSTVPPASNGGYEVTLFDLTFLNASSDVLLTLNDLALSPDTAAAQSFFFAPVAGVAAVRLDIEAVQSSPTFTGLAEVGFNAVTAVPEPSSLVLCGVALSGLAGLRGVRGRTRARAVSPESS